MKQMGVYERYILQPRAKGKSGYGAITWLVAMDTTTNKIVLEPGSKHGMYKKFSDSKEAFEYLSKL